MNWRTKVTREEIPLPDGKKFTLEIEELENLEETIDELFLELERTGKPELLEDLCPYFGCVWPSARGLAEYLLMNSPEKDEGAVRLLEVGCGLAVPSIALARNFRLSKIVATDFHPEVPAFLKENLARNRVSAENFEYRELDWRKPPADLGKFGIVIGSDILYEKSHPGDLAEALVQLVKPSGRVIIADPGRPYLSVFVDEMKARGFFAKPITFSVANDPVRGSTLPAGKKDVFIYDFSKEPIRDF